MNNDATHANPDEPYAWVSAYADGELTEAEKAEADAALAADPVARDQLDAVGRVKSMTARIRNIDPPHINMTGALVAAMRRTHHEASNASPEPNTGKASSSGARAAPKTIIHPAFHLSYRIMAVAATVLVAFVGLSLLLLKHGAKPAHAPTRAGYDLADASRKSPRTNTIKPLTEVPADAFEKRSDANATRPAATNTKAIETAPAGADALSLSRNNAPVESAPAENMDYGATSAKSEAGEGAIYQNGMKGGSAKSRESLAPKKKAPMMAAAPARDGISGATRSAMAQRERRDRRRHAVDQQKLKTMGKANNVSEGQDTYADRKHDAVAGGGSRIGAVQAAGPPAERRATDSPAINKKSRWAKKEVALAAKDKSLDSISSIDETEPATATPPANAPELEARDAAPLNELADVAEIAVSAAAPPAPGAADQPDNTLAADDATVPESLRSPSPAPAPAPAVNAAVSASHAAEKTLGAKPTGGVMAFVRKRIEDSRLKKVETRGIAREPQPASAPGSDIDRPSEAKSSTGARPASIKRTTPRNAVMRSVKISGGFDRLFVCETPDIRIRTLAGTIDRLRKKFGIAGGNPPAASPAGSTVKYVVADLLLTADQMNQLPAYLDAAGLSLITQVSDESESVDHPIKKHSVRLLIFATHRAAVPASDHKP